MLRERRELEKSMLPFLEKFRHDKDYIAYVKRGLKKYNVLEGDILNFFSKTSRALKESDTRLLFLVLELLYSKTSDESINPNEFFTDEEQRYARQYDGLAFLNETVKLPYQFENALYIDGDYLVTVPIQTIKILMDSLLLNYNFETQREHTNVIRGNQIRKTPTVNQKNIDEMTEHILNGTLKNSMLIFNASMGTAIDGDELDFNAKNMTLTVNRGTVIDIIDGYHRVKAIQNALLKNPDIEKNMLILFTNVTVSQAQEHIRQIAQAMPMQLTRVKSFDSDIRANTVVRELQTRSDLKSRISGKDHVSASKRELVSYNTLLESIEAEFKIKSNMDAKNISDYLCDFFDYLIGSYPDVFSVEAAKSRSGNLMSENVMFAGYITIAKKMLDENINITQLKDILDELDFSRDNKFWIDNGVLTDEGKISSKARKQVRNIFRNLKLM